jgi:hypothetical protein
MSSDRPPKRQVTVKIEALRSDAAMVSRLASRRGGVSVIDDNGNERFRLVIPSTRLK